MQYSNHCLPSNFLLIFIDVPITVVSLAPGTVMVMMTVVMKLMNQRSTASKRAAHAMETFLPVIMETVCQRSISVMEIMIAWMALMKMIDISAVS